jgi:hypothetical protein
MDAMEIQFARPSRSRTPFVLVLLILAAFTFSYLGAFAVPEALASFDVIRHWEPGHDPRPVWMVMTFGSLSALFCCVSVLGRLLGGRPPRNADDDFPDAGG